jgi:hypothetical protein
MPYTIVWRPDGVIVRFFGIVTFEENMAANGQLYGDPRFESLRYQIADFSEVTDFLVSEKETSIIAQLDFQSTRWNSHVKAAHVTRNKTIIKLIDLYKEQMQETSWEIGLFETLEEALDWVES